MRCTSFFACSVAVHLHILYNTRNRMSIIAMNYNSHRAQLSIYSIQIEHFVFRIFEQFFFFGSIPFGKCKKSNLVKFNEIFGFIAFMIQLSAPTILFICLVVHTAIHWIAACSCLFAGNMQSVQLLVHVTTDCQHSSLSTRNRESIQYGN